MLGVVVLTIGRASEPYIASHIDELCPGKTVVCSLNPHHSPRWTPTARVMELYRSRYRSVELVRSALGVSAPGALRKLDLARFSLWLATSGVRVVLCEFLQVAVMVNDVCRGMRIPVVAHAHGCDLSALPRETRWAEQYRRQLPTMEDIVVVSHAMRERVLTFGVEPERVHVIPCGADVGEGHAERSHTDRKSYKLLAVGRLIAKKGPIFLLESFRQVRAAGVDAELSVIGDGAFREPMRQYLRASGLESSVHFLGVMPNRDVRRHLREADLFVQHSITADDGDEEGLPVSILEAMAEGVPVVSTKHAGIPEAVADGETGFLVDPGDCQGMAARIRELLGDADSRSRMGKAGRALVLGKYSRAEQLHQLRAVLAKHWPHRPSSGEELGRGATGQATSA